MEILKTVLLAVVRAVLEFLPISAQGFVQSIACLSGRGAADSGFISAFLSIPVLVAILLIFRKTLYQLFCELISLIRDVVFRRLNKSNVSDLRLILYNLMVSGFVMLLFAPLGVSGTFKSVSSATLIVVNGIGFLVCGFVIFLSNSGLLNFERKKEITPVAGIFIGFVQGLSLVLPGFSSFGSTVAIATLFGASNPKAVKFSFLASVPTLFVKMFSCFSFLDYLCDQLSIASLIIGFIICFVLCVFSSRLISLSFNPKVFKLFGYINTAIGLALTVIGAVSFLD